MDFPFKVRKLDLSLAHEHSHPDIKVGRRHKYLCKAHGVWAIDSFTRQWYGLNFSGFYDAGLQFDAPGYNSSHWEEIWEIEE